jgi:hypothetical protein
MGLMYAWATKEYLLWEMTIGQIIMYHNRGISIKNGTDKNTNSGLNGKTLDELRKMRDDSRAQIELERREMTRKELSNKYGDID